MIPFYIQNNSFPVLHKKSCKITDINSIRMMYFSLVIYNFTTICLFINDHVCSNYDTLINYLSF